ncbi:SDR family oxidoreductase [Enterococcus avium]|uniref:SDR family oxidoreductase n=1 Tax=Enterococcus TaxID=1350 RepID=UPI0028905383|nr:SDR family oxidoreductase [Enterococcus avium]MDT2493735.1 SDR family oxidoreductase [Enterococcus avium]
MSKKQKLALITGANRGMGFEMAKEIGKKGHRILLGARNEESEKNAVKQLEELHIDADFIQIDVSNHSSILQAAETIKQRYGYLSILINNAGISLDNFRTPTQLDLDTIRKDFEVNFFGLIDVTQTMLPLLEQTDDAKILNISSEMGSLTAATSVNSPLYNASAAGYQSSKAAVNMYTIKLAKELSERTDSIITVNAIDPGMVATDFGGGTAEDAKKHGAKSIEEGIARAVELAISNENKITGTFSNTSGTVAW